jgi:prolipoprotein diacylglyceryltransferase
MIFTRNGFSIYGGLCFGILAAVFSLYLIFAGFERLLIEKIRVNARYTVFDFAVTRRR